jgi:hypothetical protein
VIFAAAAPADLISPDTTRNCPAENKKESFSKGKYYSAFFILAPIIIAPQPDKSRRKKPGGKAMSRRNPARQCRAEQLSAWRAAYRVEPS